MSEQGQVSTQEVKLPETGYTVVISQYLTIGQSRDLQKQVLRGGNYDISEGKIQNLPVDSFLDMQDKAAELLIKEIKDSSGNIVPFTKEWLYNLPLKDGNLLYERVNEVTSSSSLSEEGKKK